MGAYRFCYYRGLLCIGFLLGSAVATLSQEKHLLQKTEAKQSSELAPSQSGSSDVLSNVSRLVAITRDWIDNKLSSPGTSVRMREIGRESHAGQPVVHYHVFVSGAPKDQLYQVLEWPINSAEPFVRMEGVSIRNDGLIICAGREPGQCQGEKLDDDVDFVFQPVRGEPYRLALVSADKKTKLLFGIVPDAIISKHKSCRLEVIRVLPKFELALLRASGYQPNEELFLATSSDTEAHEKKISADGDGNYVTGILPFVANKQIGKTDVALKGLGCETKLSFEWGR